MDPLCFASEQLACLGLSPPAAPWAARTACTRAKALALRDRVLVRGVCEALPHFCAAIAHCPDQPIAAEVPSATYCRIEEE